MVEEPDVSLVAWTTTPWTLVSNLTLCVHPDMIYVRVKGKVSWERKCEVLYRGGNLWFICKNYLPYLYSDM